MNVGRGITMLGRISRRVAIAAALALGLAPTIGWSQDVAATDVPGFPHAKV